MHTGKTISAAIKDAKLNQSEFAAKLGVSRQRVNILVNMPNCSLPALERSAQALDMPLWKLIKQYGVD